MDADDRRRGDPAQVPADLLGRITPRRKELDYRVPARSNRREEADSHHARSRRETGTGVRVRAVFSCLRSSFETRRALFRDTHGSHEWLAAHRCRAYRRWRRIRTSGGHCIRGIATPQPEHPWHGTAAGWRENNMLDLYRHVEIPERAQRHVRELAS